MHIELINLVAFGVACLMSGVFIGIALCTFAGVKAISKEGEE